MIQITLLNELTKDGEQRKTRNKKISNRGLCIVTLFLIIVLTSTVSNLLSPIANLYTTMLQQQQQTLNVRHNSSKITNNKIDTQTINSNSNTRNPVLTIHIGPPKTGSTTLQCQLESLRQDLYEKDNIVYIGRPECKGLNIDSKHQREFKLFESAFVTGYDCHQQLLINEKKPPNQTQQHFPSCWNGFVRHLQNYRQNNQDIIFSDEAMSNRIVRTLHYRPKLPYPWKSLQSVLEGMDWTVRFLIVYRPLFDYLSSAYVEQYKEGSQKFRLKRWYDQSGGHCPSQGGRVIPRPFDATTSQITIARLLKPNQNLYPTPAQVYELVQSYGFTAILMNMMEKDFIRHIICEKIPHTVHTCETSFWNQTATLSGYHHRNPSLSLHYDFIAVEACHQGLINGTILSRDKSQRAIQHQQTQVLGLTPNDFPLLCPDNQTMHTILNASLDHQRRLEGKDWDTTRASCHEDAFWIAARDKRQFCTVDSKRVVGEDHWIQFFSALNNDKQ